MDGFDIKKHDIEDTKAEEWMRAPASLRAFEALYRFGTGLKQEDDMRAGWSRLRYAALHGFGSCLTLVEELITSGIDDAASPLERAFPSIGSNLGDPVLTTTL